jgi:hypothetical protein
LKLKLTPSSFVVKTIGGMSQTKNEMKDVIECALHDFAFSYMNSSEVNFFLFDANIMKYNERLKML